MCFLWYWTKSFITCSPQEKKGGKGKGLFESKVLDLILQDSLIKRKKNHFDLDGHFVIKEFDGILPQSLLISITVLSPLCWQVFDTGWQENWFVRWF